MTRTAITSEGEQRMIGGPNALHPFEKQPGGEKSESHPVASVPERKEMTGITVMWADVREPIRRHREHAFPRVVDAYVRQRGKQLLEIRL